MRVAILDDWQGVSLSLADWSGLDEPPTAFRDSVSGPALVERLHPFNAVCLIRERTPFPAELFAALPNLKLIVTAGARNAAIDLKAAAAHDVVVCGTASRSNATSQLTMALILAASRGLLPEAQSVRNGGWQRGLGRDLGGLTLGLIGLGRIGSEVAALAAPFGMDVIAWSANLDDARAAAVGVRRAPTLPALLAASDVVSLHLILSSRSRGLIGAPELARMKPDSLFVNTARGPLVEWRALLDALHAGRLGAAALDVMDDEPLSADHPLRDTALIDSGRLLLTPHLGYVTRQTYERFFRESAENLLAYLRGTPIRVLAAPA